MLSSGFFLMTRSETAVTNLVLRYREWLKHALVTSLWLGQNTRWRPLKEGGVSLGSQFHSEEHHGEEVLEHDRMLTLHPPTDAQLFSLPFSPGPKPTEWSHGQGESSKQSNLKTQTQLEFCLQGDSRSF